MHLITKPGDLESNFLNLLERYKKYYWLTAWASSKSKSFNALIKNKERIEKIIVGLHFYQTHPDFIESFLDTENIKYIQQTSGTFHPKLFIFYNHEQDWQMLVGSANFTNAAFTKNAEVTALISPNDTNAKEFLKQAFMLIDNLWTESKQFNKEQLDDYRKTWNNFKPKINSLTSEYGRMNTVENTKEKPIFLIPIANMNWHEFVSKVHNEKYHPLSSRLEVLKIAKELFSRSGTFDKLSEDERKFIAGIPNSLPVAPGVDWGLFGSMRGAGKFKNKIIQNNPNISSALEEIPISGQITKAHYERFLEKYKIAFEGNYLATASRLLAMKRPDVFVCLDSKNKAALCKDFGIRPSGMNYERYWNDIIERIYDSDWWQNPEPKDEIENKISEARSAFLDCLYYIQ
ncbi:MAG: restriction endonuclease PLD domain-containing protein [Patescibacteria group bacterium]